MKKGIFKTFYRHPAHFLHADVPNFQIMFNPVIGVRLGMETATSGIKWYNTRGVELRGQIDDFFGFYAYITDNQVTFPEYVRQYVAEVKAVPGAGYHKRFRNKLGFDYFLARGYITFSATEHVHFQFGHDKNFIGHGYRSLFLSDFGNDYLFFKVNARVWRMNYQSIFAQSIKEYGGSSQLDTNLVRKYLAIHHLSWNIGKHFNLGIFEGIVFARENIFELQYLNPLIFYRSIEQALGSPDNVLIGFDFRALIARRFSLYGQFLIDELNFREEFDFGESDRSFFGELFHPKKWWGTKFSAQLGLKYIDVFGLQGLDAQFEANFIRPYTYGHRNLQTSWSHYNHPLAHPLGANTTEMIGIVRYQPRQDMTFHLKYVHAKFGADDDNSHFGKNILVTYNEREQDFGVNIHQGYLTKLNHAEFRFSYQPWHNLYVDFIYEFRKQSSELAELNAQTHFASGAVRFNIPHRSNDF